MRTHICPTLPLGQGERNLQLDILEVTRREGRRTLDTVQVVVETGALGDEKRARNTLKVDVLLEVRLKGRLDGQEGFLLLELVFNGRGVAGFENVHGRKASKRRFAVESGCHGGLLLGRKLMIRKGSTCRSE